MSEHIRSMVKQSIREQYEADDQLISEGLGANGRLAVKLLFLWIAGTGGAVVGGAVGASATSMAFYFAYPTITDMLVLGSFGIGSGASMFAVEAISNKVAYRKFKKTTKELKLVIEERDRLVKYAKKEKEKHGFDVEQFRAKIEKLTKEQVKLAKLMKEYVEIHPNFLKGLSQQQLKELHSEIEKGKEGKLSYDIKLSF